MKIPLVDLKSQYSEIKDSVHDAIDAVLTGTTFIGGEIVETFEKNFAAYCRNKHCLGVGNGTDAIQIVLKSFGVGPGDEVITVANTFIATSEAISATGAKVAFVDCDPDTFNLDIREIEAAITPRTKAIVAVHLYGLPCDMESLKSIASKHGLVLIEDAAQAHGAEIDGQRVGSLGHAACFSFYPGKNLGAYGDGGAIVTGDAEIANKCRMIANHGRTEKYNHKFEAMNSRLDAIQAAVLNCKLSHIEAWTEKRRAAAALYNRYLADNDGVMTPKAPANARHVYHLYVVRLKQRESVKQYLAQKGIATGIHYPIALPNLEAYQYLNLGKDAYPHATRLSGEILSLPMFPEITKAQIEYICHHLDKITRNV